MVGNTVRECRFCMEEEVSAAKDGWLAPCRCSGTLKWVHRKCLEKWMGSDYNGESGLAVKKLICTICKSVYHRRRCSLKPIHDWSFSAEKLSLILFGEPLADRFFNVLVSTILTLLMRMAISPLIGVGLEQMIVCSMGSLTYNPLLHSIYGAWERWVELRFFIDNALFGWTIDNISGVE